MVHTVNNELVVSMWPVDMNASALIEKPMSEMEEHELVPEETNALDEWAYICQRQEVRDNSRKSVYVLSCVSPAKPDEVFEVSLRLQGFVRSCVLTPLGNWIK